MEVSPDELREAVESQHGGQATVITGVEVVERFQGEIAWQGVVYVFAMEDQPQGATRAYAWSHSLDDSDRRRFITVLGIRRMARLGHWSDSSVVRCWRSSRGRSEFHSEAEADQLRKLSTSFAGALRRLPKISME